MNSAGIISARILYEGFIIEQIRLYLTTGLNIRKTRDTVAVIHVSVVVMASLD